MHNYCKTIGALAAASALVAGNAQAEVEYELHTGYSSEYIFRGLNLGQNMVEVGADVAGKWDKFGLSAGVWAAAFDAEATTGNQVDNEVDWYTEATYDFGFMTGGIGYIYYWNLGNLGLDAQEVYFSASRDFGFATASLTYYWSVDGPSNDGYTELALSRSFELSPCLALNVKSSVGYLVEEGDFTSWTNRVSLDWGFAGTAKLSPFVSSSIALGEGGNGSAWRETNNEYSAGTMLSVSF